MKKLLLPIILVAILLMSGCDKLISLFEDIDDSDTTASCRISKMVTSDGETTYDYSNNGLLTRMNNSGTWDVGVFYNSNAKISKIEYYNKDTDTLDFYMEYTWVNSSKVEQYHFEKGQNGQWEQTSKTVYDLNTDGDLVYKVSRYEKFNNEWELTSYDEYTIENKNVTKAETYVYSGGNFEKRNTTTYQYDDKNNALQELSLGSISEINQYFWFTKNNPLKIITTDDINHNVIYTADFEYQYNDKDFPVSYTRIDSIPGYTQTYTVSSIEYDCD